MFPVNASLEAPKYLAPATPAPAAPMAAVAPSPARPTLPTPLVISQAFAPFVVAWAAFAKLPALPKAPITLRNPKFFCLFINMTMKIIKEEETLPVVCVTSRIKFLLTFYLI